MQFEPTKNLRNWIRKNWYTTLFAFGVTCYALSRLGMKGELIAAWAQAIISGAAIYFSAVITHQSMTAERQEVARQIAAESIRKALVDLEFLRLVEQYSGFEMSHLQKAMEHYDGSASINTVVEVISSYAAFCDEIVVVTLHPIAQPLAMRVKALRHLLAVGRSSFKVGLKEEEMANVRKQLEDQWEISTPRSDILSTIEKLTIQESKTQNCSKGGPH